MSDFELQREAMRLASNHSAYMLARMVIELREERDELAAHVEAQNSVLENASAMGFFTTCYDSGVDHTQLCRKVAALQKETPTTSLAKHDLIKQAEALEAEAQEWPADQYTECSHVRQGILESAAELRAKAQE